MPITKPFGPLFAAHWHWKDLQISSIPLKHQCIQHRRYIKPVFSFPRPSPAPPSNKTSKELQQLLKLAIPALGVVLSDPLQTLVDSACVGQSSILQLAALGPNTAIFNASYQLFSFLGLATSNSIALNSLNAPNLTPKELQVRRHAAATALCNSLLLAVVLGVSVLVTMRYFGPRWLQSMGTDQQVLPLATEYLSIRAFAAPAVFITSALQGFCLGQQDSVLPLFIALITTLLNIFGDVYFIFGRAMGVAGAALATTMAQYIAGAAFFIVLLKRRKTNMNVPILWTGLPTFESLIPYLHLATTLIARTAVGMIAYFSMAIAATRLGTLPLAAHQMAMQTFWFLSFFPEPLSMAAQSLIAKSRSATHGEGSQWAKTLVRSGVLLGCALAVCVFIALKYLTPMLLFSNPSIDQITPLIASIAPRASLAIFICSIMMVFDGISIGAGTFRHLPVIVGLGMFVCVSVLWIGQRIGGGLEYVWLALIGFYGMRLLGHLVFYSLIYGKSVFGSGPHPSQMMTD